jgi:plasmid stability protein
MPPIALSVRATRNGRSIEAEVRAILDAAVRLDGRVKFGSALVAAFQAVGGVDSDFICDSTPVRLIRFE